MRYASLNAKLFALTFYMTLTLLNAKPANAVPLVNAEPASPFNDWFLHSTGLANNFQHLAGQFTLGNAHTITELSALLRTQTAGDLMFEIWSNSPFDLPDASLHSASKSLTETSAPDWETISGLNWLLQAGTYWAVLLPDPQGTYNGFARGELNASAPILSDYAFRGPTNPNWRKQNLNFGLRIEGEPLVSAVPVPAALPLLAGGLGFLGLMGWRRKRKVAASAA